ncbi:MAG: YncE family protein [Candidatus Sericytochromatia bacterium]
MPGSIFHPFRALNLALLAGLTLVGLTLAGCQQAPGSSQQPSQNRLQANPVVGDLAAAAGFVYNFSSEKNAISVIQAGTAKVLTTLTLPEGHPSSILASHNGKYLLVLSQDAGKLYVYAPGQNHLLLLTVAVGIGPDRVQLSEDDKKVWISLTGEDAIAELDFAQGFDKAPRLRKLPTGRNNPRDEHRMLAMGLASVAVPNSADNSVSLIYPDTGKTLTIEAGNKPAVVAIASWDGQDRMVIIGNQASNTVTLYDLDTHTSKTFSKVGETPTDIALDPWQQMAYITMAGSNDVAAIDYQQQRMIRRIPVGNRPTHIYNVSNTLQIQCGGMYQHAEIWVGNDGGDSVSLIDGNLILFKTTLPVGKGPHKIAFWSANAYVSNLSDGTVSVIDRSQIKSDPRL